MSRPRLRLGPFAEKPVSILDTACSGSRTIGGVVPQRAAISAEMKAALTLLRVLQQGARVTLGRARGATKEAARTRLAP